MNTRVCLCSGVLLVADLCVSMCPDMQVLHAIMKNLAIKIVIVFDTQGTLKRHKVPCHTIDVPINYIICSFNNSLVRNSHAS